MVSSALVPNVVPSTGVRATSFEISLSTCMFRDMLKHRHVVESCMRTACLKDAIVIESLGTPGFGVSLTEATFMSCYLPVSGHNL